MPYCLGMENSKPAFFIAPLQKPSRYSIFKRIANLVLVIAMVIVSANLWLISTEQSSNWHSKQANQLGDSLSSLSAEVLVSSLLKNDSVMLRQQLNYIVSDQHVLSASLYDKKGQLLADNNTASSIVAAHRLNPDNPLVFVQNIVYQEQIIGYLSVMLKEQEVMKYHSEYQKQLNQQVQVLMLLALGAGMLIARAFYKFRYRQLLRDAGKE